MTRNIIIGSRGSELALWQANYVKDQLKSIGLSSTIKIIKTKGDQIQHLSFDKIEGKGFFTKEIENELLSNKIDLAVHSLKDLETNQPEGLCIAAVPPRENPADCLLIHSKGFDQKQDLNLKDYAVVGTSSARRKNQQENAIDWDQRSENFSKILDETRDKKPSGYNCLVPVSGGKDSTWQVYAMKEIHGMHPLAVTFDQFDQN